ncbi:MAG: four helix bundle protein [Cyclobacteriaceae bacterium]
MDKHELMARTKQFAIRVFKLMDRLPKSEAAKVVTYQLLKSSSSVAANYRAANRGKSDADFTNKIKTVLEEADESHFWLTFIADVELLKMDDKELTLLVKESNELTAIFTASLKTLNQKKPKS